MIRRGQCGEDYAVCVEIYNVLNPTTPVDVTVFEERPAVFLHGSEGYVIVKESSVAGCAFTMVRVRPEARGRGIGTALLAVASDEARALDKGALFGRVEAFDDVALGIGQRSGAFRPHRRIIFDECIGKRLGLCGASRLHCRRIGFRRNLRSHLVAFERLQASLKRMARSVYRRRIWRRQRERQHKRDHPRPLHGHINV